MKEDTVDAPLEELLRYLKKNRGFDFTGYKRATLSRRITKRIHEVEIANFSDYIDYLEVHPEEFTLLFNTILINVTAFFRDPDAWEYLTGEIVPRLLAEKAASDPIRAWSAGCASGQEAYSIAMALAEALGLSEFRRRVKIYATDVDEEALEYARRAVYTADEVKSLSAERLERFFERSGDEFAFRPELRRSVIFGRHDLVKDPPMSHLDLILCRNVLMYLNAQTQAGVVGRLHFALNPSGALFLGSAEMLLSHTDLFAPIELKHRTFSKVAANTRREQLLTLAQADDASAENILGHEVDLRAGAFGAIPVAQLVIDSAGTLALANARANVLFGLTDDNLGRPFQDLELSYRPVELRSMIDQACQEERTVRTANVPWGDEADPRYFDVEVTALRTNGGAILGTSVSFVETTAHQALQSEFRAVTRKLEETGQAYEATHEELETTNEELQSTNEELETTNEELQSSNEELETMNEELQSTNEELRGMNDILQEQALQLDNSNAFLESVLAGLRSACVVVEPDLSIRVWKEKVEDLWGLRADEVEGQSLLDLDIGIPVAELQGLIERCLRGESQALQKTIPAVNRRGKNIDCLVTATPLIGVEGGVAGVILLMEPRTPGQ